MIKMKTNIANVQLKYSYYVVGKKKKSLMFSEAIDRECALLSIISDMSKALSELMDVDDEDKPMIDSLINDYIKFVDDRYSIASVRK